MNKKCIKPTALHILDSEFINLDFPQEENFSATLRLSVTSF